MSELRITNWEELYENAATRKLKRLAWVPIPNSSDSLGFLRMREEKDFSDIYTGWILILATASRCASRGTLMSSEGRPYTAADLELKWRFPAKKFQRAIDFCSSLGWIEGNPPKTEGGTAAPEVAGESPGPVGDSPDIVGASVGAKESKKGRDVGKGKNNGFYLGKEFVEYPPELQTDGFAEVWGDWLKHRKEIKHPMSPTQTRQALKGLATIGAKRATTAILFTISKGWRGIREPEGKEAFHIIAQQENRPDSSLADLRAKMEETQ